MFVWPMFHSYSLDNPSLTWLVQEMGALLNELLNLILYESESDKTNLLIYVVVCLYTALLKSDAA